MNAIRIHAFGEPDQMTLEAVELPAPGQGEVLIRVHAAGVNPVDTYLRAGVYPKLPSLPWTPGLDGAGVVEATGDQVDTVRVGDRVYIGGSLTGTYAERTLCRTDQVHPLPDHVTFAQGAALYVPYATAYQALFHRADAQPGQNVLIHGATGGVGLAAVQWARGRGLTVIATAGSEAGRQLLADQGVTHILDHHDANHLDQVMAITNDQGVDVILEMLANVNLADDLNALRRFGAVVVIGSRGTVEIDPRATMMRDASIHGMSLMNASPEQLRSIHAAIVAGLQCQLLDPVIGKERSLADAATAHHEVIEKSAFGKIVLVP